MTVYNTPVKPAAVPVMDFKVIHASTGDERKEFLRQLDEAWSHHGAIYVINHSIGTETLEEAFAWVSRRPWYPTRWGILHTSLER
jgi:isopenicillin N synthase-like dioxygenase